MDEELDASRKCATTPLFDSSRVPRPDPRTNSAEDSCPNGAQPEGIDEEEDEESRYSVDHLSAVVRPVALTMILAALAVSQVRDAAQDAAISSGLNMYLVYNEGSGSGSQSTGSTIGQAVVNAVVIVCVICGATFVLVACYYFRCMKLMIAYLIFASANLLGYSGGFLVMSAIQVWHVIFDWLTLAFIMYNFAVGGIVAVFWQKGVPRTVTQGYLVAVSVIMAWILTKLPEWTSWALLVFLALYDLCAVLTPCGPLRALVNLAQQRQDPIPGLLYEANVGNSNSDDRLHDTFVTEGGTRRPTRANPALNASPQPPYKEASGGPATVINVPPRQAHSPPARMPSIPKGVGHGDVIGRRIQSATNSGHRPLTYEQAPYTVAVVPVPAADAPPVVPEVELREGAPVTEARDPQGDDEDAGDRSIKLGLGDFVFYSVLVAQAALYDMSTMAACFVSVLMGLGGTLFLLGVFKKALPALPISIFLGVAFYFLTRIVVTPMIAELSLNGMGV